MSPVTTRSAVPGSGLTSLDRFAPGASGPERLGIGLKGEPADSVGGSTGVFSWSRGISVFEMK
jgi:hypothetical protein